MATNQAVQNPADLANLALVRMGYKLTVGSLFDGSRAASKILNVYAQTRDAALRNYDYDFAERTVALTLLKQAPATGYFPPTTWSAASYPPIGFAYEYAWPDDCLKVRAVKPPPMFLFNPDPQPNAFQISNDNGYTPARRVILCQVPSAIAVYTGQVTDPTTWDVAFVEYFAALLARHVAAGLVGLEGVKMEAADEQNEMKPAQLDGR